MSSAAQSHAPAEWNSFRTDARAGIATEVITYPGAAGMTFTPMSPAR